MEKQNNIVEWTASSMLEVTLNEPDDFLKVRETLTRMGVASRKDNNFLIKINRCLVIIKP